MAVARLRSGSFEADCLAGDDVGNYVYITGPAVLGIPQVESVDIKTAGKFPAVGIIAEKPTATTCLVLTDGEFEPSPASLTSGKVYWIGTDAKATAVVPLAGVGERVATQRAGYAIDAGRLLVHMDQAATVRTG